MPSGGLADADSVALLALSRLGCINTQTKASGSTPSLASLGPDDIITITSTCIGIINSSKTKSSTVTAVPSDPGARFQLCSKLAAEVNSMGYGGHSARTGIGFAAFLYPNEQSTRQLISFLLEKVSSQGVSQELFDAGDEFDQEYENADLAEGEPSEQGTARTTSSIRRKGNNLAKQKLRMTVKNAIASAIQQKVEQHVDERKNESGTRLPFWTWEANETSDIAKLLGRIMKPDSQRVAPLSITIVPTIMNFNSKLLAKEAALEERRSARTSNETSSTDAMDRTNELETRVLEAFSGSSFNVSVSDVAASDFGSRNSCGSGLFAHLTRFSDDSEHDDSSQHKLTEDSLATALIETADMKAAKRQEELRSLQGKLASIIDSIRTTNERSNEVETKKLATIELERQLLIERDRVSEELENLKEIFGITDENVEDLGSISLKSCEENLMKKRKDIEKKFNKLEAKFQAAAAPLLTELDAQRSIADAKRAASSNKIANLNELRKEVKEALVKARSREAEKDKLLEEISKLSNDEPTRESYVKRILEIIKNVKKQENEISRIIEETKEIQRSMNNSVEVLKRSHALTDDIIFKDATKGGEVRILIVHLLLKPLNATPLIYV